MTSTFQSRLASIVVAVAFATLSSSAYAQLCAVGEKVQVLWKGTWYASKVTAAAPDKCYVTYDGYTKDDDEWVGPERLKIDVLWKGDWYPSRVLSRDGSMYKIRYDGYTSADDEIVPIARIRLRKQ